MTKLADLSLLTPSADDLLLIARATDGKWFSVQWSSVGGGGGSGDVTGPASSTDNGVPRFNGTGGKTLQTSLVTISDGGDITIGGDNRKIAVGKGLTLEQTGDTFGTTRLLIQNRGEVSGALFEQAGSVDLIDFVFKTLTAQTNIRLESRAGQTYFGGDEFRIGNPSDPTLFINATGAGVEVAKGPLTVGGLPVGPNLPKSRDMSTSDNLLLTDRGQFVKLTAAITPTIPNSTFAEGDLITLVNRSGGDRSVACSITTAWVAGSDVASFTISSNQMASILFLSATECMISGAAS